jgi:ABC-type nitrate/sulfonate/bicarbonate transport system permease component
MEKMFKFDSKLSTKTSTIILLGGFVLIMLVWYLLTANIGKESIEYKVRQDFVTDSLGMAGKPVVDVRNDTIFCPTEASKYQWYFNGSEVQGVTGKTTLMDKAGKYQLIITDRNGKTFSSDTLVASFAKARMVGNGTLPSPRDVLYSYGELHNEDALMRNTAYSIGLNLTGYVEAIFLSLLIGFIIGLVPFFRAMLSRYVDAIRYIPLTAVTGIFIAWFGIEFNMKVQFLAFGIFVYLLPIVVQRIDEIEKVYLQTAFTMGATTWQTIRNVFWPSVSSRIFDDIRVLTAISWTYIIVAEMVNRNSGVGAMIYMAQRQSRLDKVFAILLVIVLVGVLQDLIFKWLDKLFFPYKYV